MLFAAACMLSFPSTANAADGVVGVVEFYNAGLEHYFISANAVEIAVLDGGAFGGAWKRTGQSYPAWDGVGAPADTVPVCRFFGTDRYRTNGSRIGPNSHFYTADPDECAFVKTGYQSLANDGISYPAWTFESNAFAVKLPAGGTCTGGTQPLYRSYNNGARGDPNHRYSTHADVLQAMAGWVFEGLVMCLPPPVPTATAVGVAVGTAASATIGAAGGTVSSPDGKFVLTIPAGALASATVIGIQPLTNTAHGKIGAAYRLTPEGQTFLQPVTLGFTYSDQDLPGTAIEFLGAAFQTADGHWAWAGSANVDTASKTVSVGSSHFSVWSLVREVHIVPGTKSVKPKGKVGLQVTGCYAPASPDARGFRCDPQGDDDLLPPLQGAVTEWSVNGTPGGGGTVGTVKGSGLVANTGPEATYTAPNTKPNPSTVAVSARITTGTRDRVRVVSNITIAEDSWTGTATGKVTGGEGTVTVTAQITWNLIGTVGNVGLFTPTGTATVTRSYSPPPGCAHPDPSSQVISADTDGDLAIDFNANPPTYYGVGAIRWPANIVCTGITIPFFEGGSYFGGRGGPLGTAAAGTVSSDGVTIEGGATDAGGIVYTWKFTRQQ